jgi:enoyl-CoA hydratase/carnithine racemase
VVIAPVSHSKDGPVGLISLNRPEKRIAINQEMRNLLQEALVDLDTDDSIHVVMLEGSPPSFCAGVDLTENRPSTKEGGANSHASITAPFDSFGKPIIASVNGAAAGGGFEIALACDFIIASTAARFLLPEVKLGSLPGAGGTQRLMRAIPRGVAARMLLTGNDLDALAALQLGLVTELVGPENLHNRTLEVAQEIARHAPLSLRAIKHCLRAVDQSTLEDGLAVERGLWLYLSKTEDRVEGRQAFREGRPPIFKGK